jgi:TatD DNase family protein
VTGIGGAWMERESRAMLVDSHCHLDFADFGAEREAVIERARAAGVGTMLTIATRLDEFAGVRAVAETHADIWCSVGAHPHEAGGHADLLPVELESLAAHPKVVGIGETGLDYHYNLSPHDIQERVFRTHIAASRTTGLPLIVHAREADDDIARILGEEQPSAGVLHCFSSGRGLAEAALALGFYISISGIVTFKNAEELRAIVRDVPLDRLLVETDSPFLAPVPYRGKRNEPAFVAATATAVAALKGVDAEALAAATTANFFRLFAKATPPRSLPDPAPHAGEGGAGGR